MLVKLLSIKFHGNPFSRPRVVACGQAVSAKLIGAVLQLLFANKPEKVTTQM
jgi:hypothetical protein